MVLCRNVFDGSKRMVEWCCVLKPLVFFMFYYVVFRFFSFSNSAHTLSPTSLSFSALRPSFCPSPFFPPSSLSTLRPQRPLSPTLLHLLCFLPALISFLCFLNDGLLCYSLFECLVRVNSLVLVLF